MPFSTVRMLKIKKKRIVWDKENHLHSVGGAIYILTYYFLGTIRQQISKALMCAYHFNLGIMHLEIHPKEMNGQMLRFIYKNTD